MADFIAIYIATTVHDASASLGTTVGSFFHFHFPIGRALQYAWLLL